MDDRPSPASRCLPHRRKTVGAATFHPRHGLPPDLRLSDMNKHQRHDRRDGVDLSGGHPQHVFSAGTTADGRPRETVKGRWPPCSVPLAKPQRCGVALLGSRHRISRTPADS